MHIWVDADACPGVVKEILYRAAERAQIDTTLVANQTLRTPPSRYVKSLRVAAGFDAADDYIAAQAANGDLVITADIPLAAAALDKGADVLSPRGERYTPDNIRQRLTMRDFMDELRGSGVMTGGPPPLGQADRKAFADELDRLLTRRRREAGGPSTGL